MSYVQDNEPLTAFFGFITDTFWSGKWFFKSSPPFFNWGLCNILMWTNACRVFNHKEFVWQLYKKFNVSNEMNAIPFLFAEIEKWVLRWFSMLCHFGLKMGIVFREIYKNSFHLSILYRYEKKRQANLPEYFILAQLSGQLCMQITRSGDERMMELT